MLRELNAGIQALEGAEKLRRETEDAKLRKKHGRGLGALGAWAVGGMSGSGKTEEHLAAEAEVRDFGLYRDGVVWFLRQKLQLCGRTQQQMMETRLKREMEKNMSVLARASAPAVPDLPGLTPGLTASPSSSSQTAGTSFTTRHHDQDEQSAYEQTQDLTPEQLQMFEKGNQDMMKHFDSYLNKVK